MTDNNSFEGLNPFYEHGFIHTYIPNYSTAIPQSKKSISVHETIEFYCSNHEANKESFACIIKELSEIRKKDTLCLYWLNTYFYLETYKILWLVEVYRHLLSLVEDENYLKKGFASFQTSKSEIMERHNREKLNVLERLGEVDIRANRARWYFYKYLLKNKNLTMMFINYMVLGNIESLSILDDLKEEDLKLLYQIYAPYFYQRATFQDTLKSFGILLYHELKHTLKFKEKDAKDMTLYMCDALFGNTPNLHEANRTVYLKSVVDWFPIFGASKKEEVDDRFIMFYKKRLMRDVVKEAEEKDRQWLSDMLNIGFENFFKKPHFLFLQRYPEELLQISNKRSR